MAGASLEIGVEVDNREVLRALQRLEAVGGDMEAAFADIGEYLLNSHRERWEREETPDGDPWAPLKPATRKRKKRNKDRILLEEGDLRDLLRYGADPNGLEFGTDRIYGATHQFGREEDGIEAREWLGLSGADLVGILDILREHLEAALMG